MPYEIPQFNLSGKRALVTGASSGIGAACAAALAAAGAHVTLAARRKVPLKSLEAELQAQGWQAESLEMDVADVEETRRQIMAAEPFDILLNSAGVARHGPALSTQVEDFDAVMSVNLRGAYFLTTTIAQRLQEAGQSGSLINISSQMGHVGGQERAVYCASKFAVEGFTKAMAIEWGHAQIRVNTICPTFILTDLTRSTFDDPQKRAWIESKIKLGRVGTANDVTGAVIYLASDASSLVTGTSLLVDGGWTAD